MEKNNISEVLIILDKDVETHRSIHLLFYA